MTITLPERIYSMSAIRSIVKTNAPKYRMASKKMKSTILNELTEITHLNRKYLSIMLNNAGKTRFTPQRIRFIADPTVNYLHQRGRKKTYTQELVPYLKIIWELTGFRSSLHLVAFIRNNQPILFQKPSPQLSHDMQTKIRKLVSADSQSKAKLLKISSATVDRLLKPVRAKYRLKHKYKPHPHASIIKKSIPVESYFDKPKQGPLGYTELDLVHHCGSWTKGCFCYTLSEVEINTSWTELRALRNKARVWTLEALADIDASVPFKIHSRHVDNGSEFINAHVFAYTQEHNINYTRSRPYQKNDAPYVESRHWTTVRCYVGYRRYDTEKEYKILERLMRLISLKHNYFMPTMKMVHKERVGGKIHKRYDINTPFQRVLHSSDVSTKNKEQLERYKKTLSYLAIVDEINHLLMKLDEAYRRKYNGTIRDEE